MATLKLTHVYICLKTVTLRNKADLYNRLIEPI